MFSDISFSDSQVCVDKYDGLMVFVLPNDDQRTMLLWLQLESEKVIKSKWLDFTHFSTKCNFFGLYWCENANI